MFHVKHKTQKNIKTLTTAGYIAKKTQKTEQTLVKSIKTGLI